MSLRRPMMAPIFAPLLLCLLTSSTQFAFAEVSNQVKTFDWSPLNSSGGKGQLIVTAGDINVYGASYSLLPTSASPYFLSILQPCSQVNVSACVRSLEYRFVGSKVWRKGVLEVAATPSAPGAECLAYGDGRPPHVVGTNQEDVARGIPYGNTPSIWSLEAAPHYGGPQYLLSVSLSTFPEQTFQAPTDFRIDLRPIKFSKTPLRGGGPCLNHWAFSDYFNFPVNIEYRVSIQLGFLNEMISTFFSGRIRNPAFTLEEGTLTVAGSPQTFPLAQSKILQYATLPSNKRATITSFPESHFEKGNAGANIALDFGSERDFESFLLWRDSLQDLGLNNGWSLRSIRDSYSCPIKGLSGFVSSNALIFSQRPPSWDSIKRTASYRMESLLEDRNGNAFKGDFSLALSQDLMKCLWGFKFDITSSVEIELTGDGNRSRWDSYRVRFDEDWWFLEISGYSFKNSTINLSVVRSSTTDNRVQQVASGVGLLSVASKEGEKAEAEAEAKAKAEAEAKAKAEEKSITCVKGKTTKKVLGKNPKCPKGFKKVA